MEEEVEGGGEGGSGVEGGGEGVEGEGQERGRGQERETEGREGLGRGEGVGESANIWTQRDLTNWLAALYSSLEHPYPWCST